MWFILGRIVLRTGLAVWRHRIALLVAGLVLSSLSVYELTLAGPSGTNADCADTTIAAVARVDDAIARAAYACLGPEMRTATEEQFVAGLRHHAAAGQVDRIADKRMPDGSRLVFYTVETAREPLVGYIVYLDAQGRVTRVD